MTLGGQPLTTKKVIDNVVIRSLIEHARERGKEAREKEVDAGDKRKRSESWDGLWMGFKGLTVGTVWGSQRDNERSVRT